MLARGGTSWDRSLQLTDEKVLKETLISSEKTKTATTKKTLKPFFLPSHLTFSFLPDSDFWILKVFKTYFYILCILHTESHVSPPFWLLKSGIFVDCLTPGLLCFDLKIFIKTAHFKNASFSWFLPPSLGLAPAQMPESLWVTWLAPSLISGQKLALQGHFSSAVHQLLRRRWTSSPGCPFSSTKGHRRTQEYRLKFLSWLLEPGPVIPVLSPKYHEPGTRIHV